MAFYELFQFILLRKVCVRVAELLLVSLHNVFFSGEQTGITRETAK